MFMSTGTKQCTIFRLARYPSATAKPGLAIPGTYGTRKRSFWYADIHKSKDPEYKHPEIQKSKKSKTQKSKTFYIYGILHFFWIFVFYTCVSNL